MFCQIFSGNLPFHSIKHDFHVRDMVLEGRRPWSSKPGDIPDLDDEMWQLVERCWEYKPENRPSATEVLVSVQGATHSKRNGSTAIQCDWDESLSLRLGSNSQIGHRFTDVRHLHPQEHVYLRSRSSPQDGRKSDRPRVARFVSRGPDDSSGSFLSAPSTSAGRSDLSAAVGRLRRFGERLQEIN